MNDKDDTVLVVEIHQGENSKISEVEQIVQGQEVSLDRLSEFTDVNLIKKVCVALICDHSR